MSNRVRFYCADGETTITAKIARMERHLAERRETWPRSLDGSVREDFNRWAAESMRGLLRNLADAV